VSCRSSSLAPRPGENCAPSRRTRPVNGAPQDVTVELPEGPKPWDNIADHFIACILDGVACQAPLHHRLIVQEMMEALLKSAETGREIRLDD
jgi:predicted dehydrogenase